MKLVCLNRNTKTDRSICDGGKDLQPRYIQIKNYLIGKIEFRECKQNDKLPSERELSDRFGISRMTARNAILELVRDGYVYRNGAKGTFVTGKKVKRNFLHVGGFSTHMKESGVENFETKVLTAESLEADAWISNKLNINIGSTCYHFIRLRIGNEQPIAIVNLISMENISLISCSMTSQKSRYGRFWNRIKNITL